VAACKYCGKQGLAWVRLRGRWMLIEPSDLPRREWHHARHVCAEYVTENRRVTDDVTEWEREMSRS
jgi:hypothetical protein